MNHPEDMRLFGRKLFAEFLGTALLVAAVVGSGIAAQRLSPNDVGLQLLENAAATAVALVAIILAVGPVSGAHLNPVVTIADRLLGGHIRWRDTTAYIVAQVAGGVAGAMLANLMYALPAVELSTKTRSAGNLWLSESVATFGPSGHHLRRRPVAPRRRNSVRRRRLYRRRLLLHILNEFRQPGGHYRTHLDQHILGHRARLSTNVHRVPDHWRRGRGRGASRVVPIDPKRRGRRRRPAQRR